MKKRKLILSTCAALMFAQVSNAQVLQPVLQWEVPSAIGEGAADLVAFMDYTEDVCMAGWAGAGAEAGLTSINSDGTTNAVGAVAWPGGSIVGPVVNLGSTSYIHYIDPITHVMTSALCTNENITEALFSYSHFITFTYEQIEFIDAIMVNHMGMEKHGILLSVFDAADGKQKAVFIAINIDPATETATYTEIPIFVGSWATFPVDIYGYAGDFYVWGYFNKNAAGTTHDNFITKFFDEGENWYLAYTKTHASYTGRDDIATAIEMDMVGNLYGISQSEDNVEPYYDHVAVFKFNPTNGKRLWVKRLGEGFLADEYGKSAAGDKLGNGLAITGSVSDGAGGRNARTWRLNSSGTTLWVKTINNTGPGTLEEGREINFCMGSGDFNVMGYRSSDDNFFIARYNTATGVAAWPMETYQGDYDGLVIDGSMALSSSPTSDIYCTFLIQAGLSVSMITTKYEQLILKENSGLEEDQVISLFPNPSADQIQITGAAINSLLQIMNVNGEIVIEKQIDNENPVIDIQLLPQGYYSVLIYSEQNVKALSFIKIK